MLRPLAIITSSAMLVAGLKYFDGIENQKYKDYDPSVSGINPTQMCVKNHYLHPFAMRDQFELKIIINHQELILPKDIGITPNCTRPLFTPNDTGLVRIRYPIGHDFTLGDFFEIWGKSFSSTTLLDNAVDAHHEIVLTVNGEVSEDYENLVLKNDQFIVVEYRKK